MAATYKKRGARDISKAIIAWTSDAAGAATVLTQHLTGIVRRVVFDPGTAAPTALYDATLTDEHGLDILGGQGANLHETNTTHVAPGVPLKDGTTTSVTQPYVDGILTLNITNAGDTKEGTVTVYLD